MNVTYPLRLFFDCSTKHVSPAVRDYLEERSDATALGDALAAWAARTPFGWFVWADPEPDEEQFPADLIALMRDARTVGAEYILFDADAPQNVALPVFDWSD